MRLIPLLSIFLFVTACATAEIGRQIPKEDTAWIEKGLTTRGEIEARLGSPNFEFLEYSASPLQAPSPSTRTKDGDTRTTTTTVVRLPNNTKAIYLHTKSQAAVLPFYANVETQQHRFWITYDESGIVKDFGFAAKPGRPAPAAKTP